MYVCMLVFRNSKSKKYKKLWDTNLPYTIQRDCLHLRLQMCINFVLKRMVNVRKKAKNRNLYNHLT